MTCSLYLKQELPPTMSAKVILDNICIKNNPTLFTDEINFEVTFTTLEPIMFPLNWKVIYVGSAVSEDLDQTLQQFEIDPILVPCSSKFEISCSPPNADKIPKNQLLCVTALILTASYRDQQFIRVGYYVHNQLIEQISMQHASDMAVMNLVSKIKRTIISDKPRITKFNIQWDNCQFQTNKEEEQPAQASLDYYFDKIKKKYQQVGQTQILCKTSEKQSTQQGDSISMMKSQ